MFQWIADSPIQPRVVQALFGNELVDSITFRCLYYPVPEYGIKEVCALAAVTPRTIHFYIQQGLLAPPQGAGRGARYSDGHVARLRLIRRLQKEHLPLSEIRRQMGTLDDEEVGRALAQGTAAAARGSALDYVKSVKARTVSKSLPLFPRRPTVDAVAAVASPH